MGCDVDLGGSSLAQRHWLGVEGLPSYTTFLVASTDRRVWSDLSPQGPDSQFSALPAHRKRTRCNKHIIRDFSK